MGQVSRDLERAFGRGLKRVREERGLKQDTLARMAGYVNHSNITKIENGQTLPSFGKALALARLLNVPMEALLVEGVEEDEGRARWMRSLQQLILGLPDQTKYQMANFFESLASELKIQCMDL